MQHLLEINENKQKTEKTFVISNIVSIVSSPSKKTYQNEANAIQDLLQYSRSSAYRQQKTASTKRGHLIAEVKNTAVKWSIKALRQEIFNWIIKNSNVRQSPITRDNLIIADADSKVKRRVPKLLLEYSMRQLHNELIASPDYGGLLGARNAKNK